MRASSVVCLILLLSAGVTGAEAQVTVFHTVRDDGGYLVYLQLRDFVRGRLHDRIETVRADAAGRTIPGSEHVTFETYDVKSPYVTGTDRQALYFWDIGGSIYVSPAGPDGAPAIPAGVLVAESGFSSVRYFPLCRASRCVITYGASSPPSERVALVTTNGEIVARSVPLPEAYHLYGVLWIDDSGFLVQAEDTAGRTHVIRVDQGQQIFATVIPGIGILTGDFDGRQYTLVFRVVGTTAGAEYIGHLSLTGTLSEVRKLCDLDPSLRGTAATLVWTGTEHRFVYNEEIQREHFVVPELLPARIRVFRLSADLALLAAPLPLTADDPDHGSYLPSVVVNGQATYIAWSDGFAGSSAPLTARSAVLDSRGNVTMRDVLIGSSPGNDVPYRRRATH